MNESKSDEVCLLETYTEPRALVENPNFNEQKTAAMSGFTDDMVDAPIVELINAMNRFSSCFTLQCCYGHFLYEGQTDPESLLPLPKTDTLIHVEYRIAYIAFCVDKSPKGRELLSAFKGVVDLDPENIQLCSADWFWDQQVNSYALQVEPNRYKDRDKMSLQYAEALAIEKIRNQFFTRLKSLIRNIDG